MKKILATFLVLWGTCIANAAPEEDRLMETTPVGNGWILSIAGTTGNIKSCGITKFYKAHPVYKARSGTKIIKMLLVTRDKTEYEFSILSEEWAVKHGEKYPITFKVDGDDQEYTLSGNGVDYEENEWDGVASGVIPDFLLMLAVKREIQIKVSGEWVGNFNLKGSGNAIMKLKQCEDMIKN